MEKERTQNKIFYLFCFLKSLKNKEARNRLWFIISGAFDADHHQHLRNDDDHHQPTAKQQQQQQEQLPRITITISTIKQF